MVDGALRFAALDDAALARASAVCIGTGRFLRAVLVPALAELGCDVVLAQTRGTSFGKYMASGGGRADRSYEVDTVLADGRVVTKRYRVAACGSLGVAEGRKAFMALPARLERLRYVGLGVTEAGIVHNGVSIIDLAELLHGCFAAGRGADAPISILNTDNVPFNGDSVRRHVLSCDFTTGLGERAAAFTAWLEKSVIFHNTMVDRITAMREGVPEVPRAEPLPVKALVIEDLRSVLPAQLGAVPGVLVRTEPGVLALDIQLKLRVANGLHSAMVYVMALSHLFKTDRCTEKANGVLAYLEQLFERDIVHMTSDLGLPRGQVTPVFMEWMKRLTHAHFGLDCFFVCQNAVAKLGIRLMPSVKATLAAGEAPSPFMAFALAAALRFLTPVGDQPRLGEHPPVFVGKLDPKPPELDPPTPKKPLPGGGDKAEWQYTPALKASPATGTYEFTDGDGFVPLLLRPLGRAGGASGAAAASITADVLSRVAGCDPRATPAHAALAGEVGELLRRMLCGEPAIDVLRSLAPTRPIVLGRRQLREAVAQEVDAAEAVDVHTHLFAACHGAPLMQYGIDAMLTYHYLVAQYLTVAPVSADAFAALPKERQAERVWQALFVDRSPLSEPCKGVLTTLHALGLHEEVAERDLAAIRRWYAGQDGEMFNEKVMRLARLRYVVCSHSIFDPGQAAVCLAPPPQPPRYRAALEVDALLEAGWPAVAAAARAAGEPPTLRGVYALLDRCVSALKPEFVSASTPDGFEYAPGALIVGDAAGAAAEPAAKRSRSDAALLSRSDAMLDAALDDADGDHSVTPAPSAALDLVLLPLCRARGLPLLLRMGTRRRVNPALGLAGDAVGAANPDALRALCAAHPRQKFLATVLGEGDQHELAVLASKFRNLHIWGCWWFCNIPSVVEHTSALRLETLGAQFTFQASSSRVHDQLVHKWLHARELLARLLASKYAGLMDAGWRVSRGDIRRDVRLLLGGAYEEFLKKSLD